MEKYYRRLPYFFLLLIPITLFAFYKTYLSEIPHFSEKNNVLIHLHAAIAVGWLAMLIAQPFLIRNNQYELHRKIGKLSYVVFPLFILSFIPQIVRVFLHDDPRTIFFPVADCILMITFYVLALRNKRDSGKHMRYMIALVLCFLFPTLNRIATILLEWSGTVAENVIYAAIYSILLFLIWQDNKNQKNYKPFVLAIPLFMGHQIVFHLMFVFAVL